MSEQQRGLNPSTWNRADFKKNADKVLALAGIAASWTPSPKDDSFIDLLTQLFSDSEKFTQVCDIIGIPK